jgi:oligopeptide/dipeptide ABC transporter ATP-binding protein
VNAAIDRDFDAHLECIRDSRSPPRSRTVASPPAAPRTPRPRTQALVDAVPPRKQRTSLGGELPDAADLPTGCRFHPRCPKRFEPCDREDPPLFPAGEPTHEAACLLLRS